MSQNLAANCAELLMRLRREGMLLWEENGNLRYRAPEGMLTDSDLQALKDYKMDFLDVLRAESQPVTVIPDPQSRFEPFPLTDVQSAYLLGRHELFGYGGVACHIYIELTYPELDPNRTEAAWNQLILRHDMLRATIDQNGHQQVMQSVPYMKVTYTDTSSWEEQKAEARLDEIREEMGHRIYDTARWPLFDISVTKAHNRAVLHFSMEFLIADWASIWLLLSEFEALYKESGRQLPDLNLCFRDYLLAERSLKKTTAYFTDKDYWLRRVDTLPPAPDLPLARQQDNSETVRFRRRFLRLDNSAWDKLKQRAQKRGLTPTAAVMTAYAAVIERWSRSKTFCLNLTLLNRLPLHAQVHDIVGDFTSVNLLAVDWRMENSFHEHAKALQKQLFEDLDHRLFSGVEVLREVARRRGREAALMPVVFTSAIGLVEPAQGNQLIGKIDRHGISQTPQVFIDCQAMDSSAGLQVNWDVREGVFPDRMVDDMFDTFEELLRSLAKTDQSWDTGEVITLPAWQLTERHHINATTAPLPDQSLHQQVLAQATATPDLPAVFDSEGQVTYGELVQRAAAVAEKLKELHCAAQDQVAVVMDKCAHQVAAVLGALSVGAVYVPIDTRQPELRRLAMLEQANVRFVLTCSTTQIQWPDKIKTIEVDKLQPHQENTLICEGNPNLPAYIIYTSGSTGQPKGVVISHRAAANTIADINRRFNINQGDRVLGLAQLSFDLSVYDIFGPLSVGGALVYPSADRQTDPSHWAELMVEHEVTVWNSVPALMQMLVAYLNSELKIALPNLRLALLSGDWIPLTLPDAIIKRLPAVQVIGLGGATEASIWSIYHNYKELKADWRSIPYGRPLANQGFRVLDSQMRDCPVWVTGELYITGHGLSEGYLGDQATTQERFLLHPADGQRLYRTGDLGRYTPGGEIEFLGRRDNQIKIKGHRIELGEIESALLKHPAVAAAGVVVDDSSDDKVLLGVVETARKKERDIDTEKLEFNTLVNGIGEQASAMADGISRAEVKSAIANLDQAVLNSMLYALQKRGLFSDGKKYSMEDILQCDGIVPKFHWLVQRWVAKLTEAGLLLEHPVKHFSCSQKPDGKRLNEYWKQAETSWTKKLGSTGFTAYVRSNAEKLPELLSGQQDPVSLLFPEGKLDHVRSLYFDHIMANYLNHCICTLLQRIAENQSDKPLRILEVGAGTGATTEKVLKSLEGFEVEYLFTDVTTFFIPGAKSRFGQFPGIRFGIFDVDKDYRTQGLAPNSFDVVLAAGVLENARDIPASMNRLEELICPGGWLVFTEPTEEHMWILASQAFMMTEPGDHLRLEASYLDRSGWIQLLKEFGDEPVLSLPEEQHKLSSLGFHLFAKRFKQDRLAVRASELENFLSLRLPAYMLPSHLQIADALPLTGNGKIDRRELAKWRPKSVIKNSTIETDEERLDTLEAQLAQLWAESLSIPSIGRLQSFYEHGADSLIMAQVAGKLRDKLAGDSSQEGIPFDVLLRQMLNYPTVAALAEFIRSYSQEAEHVPDVSLPDLQSKSSNAVLTSYGGNGTGPLSVVFHAVLGTMDSFRPLLEHLKSQNVGCIIGITIADIEQYCTIEPSELIETVADDYVERLLENSHKQMQLIGYSLGGLIAIEVARRLVERGVLLTDVVLIDIPPILFDVDDDILIETLFISNLNITLEQAGFGGVDQDDLARGIMQIIENNGNRIPKGALCEIEGDDGLNKVGDLFRRLATFNMRDRFTAYVNALAKATGEQMPVEMAEGLFKVFRQSFKAARFTPLPYMGNIRFFLAREPFSFFPRTDEMTLDFWREVCLGEFEVTEIEGNHFSCIKEPNVTSLARLISVPLIKK
ncbi:non-ribosomal peptide synthetase [Aneurinibacillus aneurinilyticus]|uniref:AMP-binding enzyme n=1 Tax=Aneurinibacillus aneurinilyticus ATCC 12856 TaxID=649747 RepID=U1YJS1_ANEAE|nr:non-ribosomal peptide synthetase [Aneurinibacillus aneurinilyticus]ERI11046.1 AMP-binding enzyme [Aneurinibacillus aneurinilyticus ATCC 12856]MED0708776.1 non-ribosomal peptide synthetase [Aneurinibacillus aneurinilyticus]MED0722759.1 non-ribosomal peptide synthetase [Aneurinibacillus aneurinilyticus]MED0733591.1 non-ribosomal peptide synthetase [Aneurinibacillus aneurinilyticus]MED0739652.1 non-ribosomal peptide synthetase [Aneurinibacillus aneurinilyticus]